MINISSASYDTQKSRALGTFRIIHIVKITGIIGKVKPADGIYHFPFNQGKKSGSMTAFTIRSAESLKAGFVIFPEPKLIGVWVNQTKFGFQIRNMDQFVNGSGIKYD